MTQDQKPVGPLMPQHMAEANERGNDLVVYEGYAVEVSRIKIVDAASRLAAMDRSRRRGIMKSVARALDQFTTKYPIETTDIATIPAEELSEFKADVALHFADVFRRGEHEQHRMPDWMTQKN